MMAALSAAYRSAGLRVAAQDVVRASASSTNRCFMFFFPLDCQAVGDCMLLSPGIRTALHHPVEPGLEARFVRARCTALFLGFHHGGLQDVLGILAASGDLRSQAQGPVKNVLHVCRVASLLIP